MNTDRTSAAKGMERPLQTSNSNRSSLAKGADRPQGFKNPLMGGPSMIKGIESIKSPPKKPGLNAGDSSARGTSSEEGRMQIPMPNNVFVMKKNGLISFK